MIPKLIVGETTKNWVDGQSVTPHPLLHQFALLIEDARRKGYRLRSWQLARASYSFDTLTGRATGINETIVAIFEQADEEHAESARPEAGREEAEEASVGEPLAGDFGVEPPAPLPEAPEE